MKKVKKQIDIQTQWKQDRQKTITATDCLFILKEFGNENLKAKLQNANVYDKTRYQFYMEKTVPFEMLEQFQEIYAKLKPDAQKRMEEGKQREDEVAQKARQDLGFDLQPNGQNVVVLDEYNIGATPDYYIKSMDSLLFQDAITNTPEDITISKYNEKDFKDLLFKEGILECKLTAPINDTSVILAKKNNSDKFTDLSDEEIKQILWDEKVLGYTLQVQQQLLCTRMDWAVIAVAVKEDKVGSDIAKMHYEFVKANPKIHDLIIEAVQNAWKWIDDVENGKADMPKPNKDNEKDRIYETAMLDDIKEVATAYIETNETYKAMQYNYDILKEKLKIMLGTADASLELNLEDGSKVNIKQKYTQPSFFTEEAKNEAIVKAIENFRKARKIEIGSIKTVSKLHKLEVKLV